MTRGQRGKIRFIVFALIACLSEYTGSIMLSIIGFSGIGFFLPEAVFGDFMERRQKDIDTLDS